MIKIAILDDEKTDLEKEKKITEDYFAEKKIEHKIAVYQSEEWFLGGLQEEAFDVYILDMEMPVKKGVEVAREIRKAYPDPIIIFITNYMDHVLEAFEVNCWRYIPKTNLKEGMLTAYEAVIPILMAKEKRCYIIEKRMDLEKISYSDILYLQKEGKYVVITHRKGTSKVRKSLDTVMKELDSNEFIKIEKGYIVNIKHVMRIKNMDAYMRDGVMLPIGKKRIAALKAAVVDYWR